MPDITMCSQTRCPNSDMCYRHTAEPSQRQSWATFSYTVSVRGVECGHFISAYIIKAEAVPSTL